MFWFVRIDIDPGLIEPSVCFYFCHYIAPIKILFIEFLIKFGCDLIFIILWPSYFKPFILRDHNEKKLFQRRESRWLLLLTITHPCVWKHQIFTILYFNVLGIICGRGSALDLCLTRRVVVVKGVPINIVPGPCASSALYVYLVVLGISIKMSFMHV